jgi:transposase-like protein
VTEQHDDRILELAQELFAGRDGARRLLEALVNQVMEAEVSEHLGAGRHERSAERRGWRNGSKPRRLKTRSGEFALRVPQVRQSEPYHPSLFGTRPANPRG